MFKPRRSSVRWRIVLIYFVLVFIAMTAVSVFLIDRIEDYQLSSVKQNITNTVSASKLLSTLSNYESMGGSADAIQRNLSSSWTGSFGDELSVVDFDLNICASTNTNLVGKAATDVFDIDSIASCLEGGSNVEYIDESGEIPVLYMNYPVEDSDTQLVKGVLCVRVDLSSIESFISQARVIFVEATVMALLITIGLGFILARSITDPINDVTDQVIRMSQGDFDTSVSVKSDDEIGQLATMFNMLRERLDETLTEISGEKNKLGTILEYMGDGLVAIDFEGNIIHANPAVLEMLRWDYGMEDLTYDRLLGHLSENLSLETVMEKCKDGGAEDSFAYKDSIFAVRYDRFKDETGTEGGIIFIMQDITERQKLEDMQTDFVANVSHELKTPLTNIKSYTETLLDGAIDDKELAVNFLGIVDSEADRMNRLVKDLLQLSRMDNRQETMHLKESNIVAIINMAVLKVELTAQQKHQQLNQLYELESDIRADVDRDRFEQVILNLLSNAIKYTEDGGRIDVDVYPQGGDARIVVQDNGMGIPESSLPRIFDRFYRVDKARSRAMGGTGLGLAITKQIVEAHGGHIEAESREGHGTKMIITLPLSHKRGVRNIE